MKIAYLRRYWRSQDNKFPEYLGIKLEYHKQDQSRVYGWYFCRENQSLNSNSNLKSNLGRTCFENSNLKMYAHNDENTNCVFGKRTHVDHNF